MGQLRETVGWLLRQCATMDSGAHQGLLAGWPAEKLHEQMPTSLYVTDSEPDTRFCARFPEYLFKVQQIWVLATIPSIKRKHSEKEQKLQRIV